MIQKNKLNNNFLFYFIIQNLFQLNFFIQIDTNLNYIFNLIIICNLIKRYNKIKDFKIFLVLKKINKKN